MFKNFYFLDNDKGKFINGVIDHVFVRRRTNGQ